MVDDFFERSQRQGKTVADLDTLRGMGRVLRLMVSHPDFPDDRLRRAVQSRIELNDIEQLALGMTDAQADAVLTAAGLL